MPLLAEQYIRDIPDFPTPGILFKDITPVLNHAEAFQQSIDLLADRCRHLRPDAVVGIEARGFVFGAPVALALGVGFVPVRKLGKLPGETLKREYELEYGTNTVEIHLDSLKPGQRVVIVDDLLATGGTSRAAAQLVEELGAQVVGLLYLVELDFLPGRETLAGYQVESLIHF